MREIHIKDEEREFLEPGFHYIVQTGLENATLRNLCKVTKISSGSLYYWFDNKEEFYVNIAEYGFKKIVNELYGTLFLQDCKTGEFFDKFLAEIQRLKSEFRMILQIASSPIYGQKMREMMKKYKPLFMSCAEELSKKLNCDMDETLSIIYSLRSILCNYVIFENYEDAKKEADLLCRRILVYR